MAEHSKGGTVKSQPSRKLHRRLAKWLPSVFMRPFMTPAELHVFQKYSKGPGHVVEFGSGGSTLYFLRKGKKVYSVDNHRAFFEYLNTIWLVRWMKARGRLHFCFVDIGPTKNWGYPAQELPEVRWSRYYQSVWDLAGARHPGILFVDGRFRVMCLLCAIEQITPETVVIVHDFWARPHYHDVLNFYHCVDRIDTLAILSVKEGRDAALLQKKLEEFAFDFR